MLFSLLWVEFSCIYSFTVHLPTFFCKWTILCLCCGQVIRYNFQFWKTLCSLFYLGLCDCWNFKLTLFPKGCLYFHQGGTLHHSGSQPQPNTKSLNWASGVGSPSKPGGRFCLQTHISVMESHFSKPGTQLTLSEASCFKELWIKRKVMGEREEPFWQKMR